MSRARLDSAIILTDSDRLEIVSAAAVQRRVKLMPRADAEALLEKLLADSAVYVGRAGSAVSLDGDGREGVHG